MGTTDKLTDHRSLSRSLITLLATMSLLATQLVGVTWADPAGAEEPEPEPVATDLGTDEPQAPEGDHELLTLGDDEGCAEDEPVGEEPAPVDCEVATEDPCALEQIEELDCSDEPALESGEEEEFVALDITEEMEDDTVTLLAAPGSGVDGLGFEIDGNFTLDGTGTQDWTDRPYQSIVDATSPHTVFSGGTKFGERSEWSWTSGNAPGKADILRLYADVEIAGSEAWLRIAGERDGSSGDTWVSFELNQDNDGPFLGNSGVPVTPTEGDLLITFGYPGNNTTAPTVILERWSGTAWVTEQNITSFAAVNTVLLDNPTGQELAVREFLELSIDVSWLFGADAPCRSFGASWAFSRSSNSGPSSQMQDFIAPFPFGFDTCASPTLKKIDDNGGNGLAGAVLALYAGDVDPLAVGFDDDPVFGPCTTNANGECTGATGLKPGGYTLFEVVPPPGFRYSDDRTTSITLSDNDDGTYKIANPPISYLIEIDDDDTNAVGNEHDFEVSLFADFIFDYDAYHDNGTISYEESDDVDLPLAGERIDLAWSGPTDSGLAASTSSDGDGDFCTTSEDGTCTVTVESTNVGKGTLTASYGTGLSGPAASSPANATAGGYFSSIADTADKTWVAFDATIESDGENLIDEDHTFKVTVHQSDDEDVLIGDVEVEVTWDGPVGSSITGDGSEQTVTESDPTVNATCTTEDDDSRVDFGTCTFTVSSSDAGAGTATIMKLIGSIGGEGLVVTGDSQRPHDLIAESDAWTAFSNDAGDRTATKQWIRFVAAVTPKDAINRVDDDHTFTIDVVAVLSEDTDGAYTDTRPASATTVTVTWTPDDGHDSTIVGPGDLPIDGDGLGATCTTDENGTCEVTVSSGGDPGSGTLAVTSIADFWVDTNLDGEEADDGEERRPAELTADDEEFEADRGTKTWLAFLVSITPDEATNLLDDGSGDGLSEHVFDVEVYVASEVRSGATEAEGGGYDWQLLVLEEGQSVTIVADPNDSDTQIDWKPDGAPYRSDTCSMSGGSEDGTPATCTITANSKDAGSWTIEATGITLDGIVDGDGPVDLTEGDDAFATSGTVRTGDIWVVLDNTAEKTWIGYGLEVTPDEAYNPLAEDPADSSFEHTFTVTLRSDDPGTLDEEEDGTPVYSPGNAAIAGEAVHIDLSLESDVAEVLTINDTPVGDGFDPGGFACSPVATLIGGGEDAELVGLCRVTVSTSAPEIGDWFDAAGTATITASFDGADHQGHTRLYTDEGVKYWSAIELVKTANPTLISAVTLPTNVTYTFDVTNHSPVPLSALTLTDTFFTDGGSPIVDLTDALIDAIADALDAEELDDTLERGEDGDVLHPGESVTVTYVYSVPNGTSSPLANIATVTGTDPGQNEISDSDNASVTITPPPPAPGTPQITLDKTANPTSIVLPEGEDATAVVTYTYTALNSGTVTLTNVTLTDDVLGDLTDELREALGGSSMSVGQSVTFTVDQTVGVPDVGLLVNIATVSGTGGGSTVTDTDTATVEITQVLGTVFEPSIDIVKEALIEADADGRKTVTVPEGGSADVTYRYTITNTGDTTLTDITLDDDVIGELTDLLDVTTLEPGESTIVEVTYATTAADLAAGRVDNVGIATGTSPQGATVDARDDESVSIVEVRGVVQQQPTPVALPQAEQLPRSGSDTTMLTALGLVLTVLGGATLLLGARRRRGHPL